MRLTVRRRAVPAITLFLLCAALPLRMRAAETPDLASPSIEKRVDDLLGKMTLEEKVGQLVQEAGGVLTGPGAKERQADIQQRIAEGKLGSVLNAVGADRTNALQRAAVEKSRLHIPLLFGYDVIHGHRTIFPVPLAMASTWDPVLVERAARIAATEASADGIRWVFSPMVDIARDARWGRIVESAGEDPRLGEIMARAYVRGYQGEKLSDPTSVAACVKHFAAYGMPIGGRDYNAVELSEGTLRQFYLTPYRAGVDAGAATLMSSFNTINGVPASANPFTLTKVLRQEWQFKGFVVSDWGAVRELIPHGFALDMASAAQKALTAGVDMDMAGNAYGTQLADLVRSGKLPESVVDEAVRRVLRVKFALGLFENPYTAEKSPGETSPQSRVLAREIAEKSIILLKNDAVGEGVKKVLPLSRPSSIALIGPLADSQADMLGSWIAQGKAADAVTLRTALQAKAEAIHAKLVYAKGTDILSDSEDGFAEALEVANRADVVIMALGESGPKMSGEGASRAYLDLPGNQEKLLEAVSATGKPIVLVLFNGHPLALPWAAQHVPAILEAWFPGIEAGNAVANILFGDVNPSGHLTVSIPRSVGQEPLYYSQYNTGRPATGVDLSHPPNGPKEKFVSRYIDELNTPLFPFGWGLSYSEFTFSQPKLDIQSISLRSLDMAALSAGANIPDSAERKQVVKVFVTVRNIGLVAGDEVVQLYLQNTGTSVVQPVRELKKFSRLSLKPGESKQLEFPLTLDDLSFLNAEFKRTVEPSRYTVWVGESSSASQHAEFSVTR
jgi:beta-glucosidase